MKRKSQIKMTETIGIIIIFFVIVLFALIFYSQYQKSALTKQKQEILAKDVISLSLRTAYLQEIRCEQTTETGTCIDLYKLDALKQVIQENETFYSNLFGTANIYFKDIINKITYDIYNNTLPDFTKKTRITTPILLRDVTKDKNYFGVLYVDYYQ